MEAPEAVLRSQWSASTLLEGIRSIDQDCLQFIKKELPDDPHELKKFYEALYCFYNVSTRFIWTRPWFIEVVYLLVCRCLRRWHKKKRRLLIGTEQTHKQRQFLQHGRNWKL